MRFAAALVAATLLGCSAAPPAPAAWCPRTSVLAQKQSVRRLVGKGSGVIGAEVIIAARAGISREYVEHAARCEFGGEHIYVRVLAAGGGYSVMITSDVPTVANEIVERVTR